jgi:hypothetical protein
VIGVGRRPIQRLLNAIPRVNVIAVITKRYRGGQPRDQHRQTPARVNPKTLHSGQLFLRNHGRPQANFHPCQVFSSEDLKITWHTNAIHVKISLAESQPTTTKSLIQQTS